MTNKKHLVIVPTNYCDFDCQHCGVKKSKKKDYISLSIVKKILRIAKKQNFEILTLTGGGEPSINFKKMVQIIKLANNHGFETRIVTNASFLLKKSKKDRMKELKKSGLKRIVFSVDQFHLKFISYNLITKAVRYALELKMEVGIKVASTIETEENNLKILKMMAEDLGGKLIKLFPIKIGLHTLFKIFSEKGAVSVSFFPVSKSGVNYKISPINFKRKELKRIAFRQCMENMISVDMDGNILPCCTYHSVNNPKLFKFGHVSKLENNSRIENYDQIFKETLFDRLGFLKLYLKIRKDKRLKKIFFKKEYYSQCDFCSLVRKYKRDIQKIPSPSKLEILSFMFHNLTYLAIGFLERLYFLISKFLFGFLA